MKTWHTLSQKWGDFLLAAKEKISDKRALIYLVWSIYWLGVGAMSQVSLAQLGMNSEANPRDTHRGLSADHPSARAAMHPEPIVNNTKDYFIEQQGVKFAGVHLLIDLWGAINLDKIDVVECALREAAETAGATLLHTHLHHFTPNGGITGVMVLAESHISIHTWPERSYAALDVFMCGLCDPYKTLPALRVTFRPAHVSLSEQKRGLVT